MVPMYGFMFVMKPYDSCKKSSHYIGHIEFSRGFYSCMIDKEADLIKTFTTQ